MIGFWIAAALLSAGVSVLIIQRASRAAALATTAGEDPAVRVFRRQLREIDDLSDRGLIPPEEQRSARAEAARRLLSAADGVQAMPLSPASGRGLTLGVAAGAPLAGVLIYLMVGSPQTPDQPFAGRAAAWRAADPANLDPERMAVVLEAIARDHPRDPQPLYYLARAQQAAGDPFTAEHSLRRALALAPGRVDFWSSLGEVLATEAGGDLSEDAHAAFARASALDPAAPGPRYYLARERIAHGDAAGGVAAWRALLGDLAANDPRHASLTDEIAAVEKTGALASVSAAGATDGAPSTDQNAFIRGMVNRLAARLQANPDDPAGWAQLVRSYRVLGDRPHQAAALARARALFKDRPDALRVVAGAGGAG